MLKKTFTTPQLITLILLLISNLVSAQPQSVSLKKGQVISFIAAHFHNAEAQKKAGVYFQKVFPLAQKHSFTSKVVFNALEIKEQHFTAGGFGIYTWDSRDKFDAFNNEKEWPALKATRPQYWKNLRSVHINVKKDRELNFDKNKVYRITFIWLHDFYNSEENLNKYLKAMRPVINRLGGKFVIGFNSEEIFGFSALNNDRMPDRVAITEWPDEETHQKYISSIEFKDNKKYFFASVAEFEAFDTKARVEGSKE